MFANLLIILPSTGREELIFGYLICFRCQSHGRARHWLMGHFLAKEWNSSFISGLSLLFTLCPLSEAFLRDQAGHPVSWGTTEWGLFLTCCAALRPHSPPNRKGLCHFRMTLLWPKQVSEKKRVLFRYMQIYSDKLWLGRLRHKMRLEIETWKHLDCEA